MASFGRAKRKSPSRSTASSLPSSHHRPLCLIHNPEEPPAMPNGRTLELGLDHDISLEFGHISVQSTCIVAAATTGTAANPTPPLRLPSPPPSSGANNAIIPLRAPVTLTTSSSSSATAAAPATETEGAAKAVAVAVAAGRVDEKGRCTPCREERLAARRYRWKVIIGLIFPFALQALDVTIIASALPWIATDFGEVSQLNWIISAFNLTSAAFIPFWGQAADIFGRHAAIQAALLIMMVGSALCTAALTSTFAVLLLGRAIQGLGCAGLNVVVRVILLDRVSLRENAKNWSIFSFTAGMSYGVGPVVGGALTNINWRWCFAINLPICVAAMALIYIVLRPELLGPRTLEPSRDSPDLSAGHPSPNFSDHFEPPAIRSGPRRPPINSIPTSRLRPFLTSIASIDIGGQLLFLFGLGLLILALTWAGATYGWATAAVLVPLCVGLLLVAAFIAYEHLMAPGRLFSRMWPRQKSMLPWALLGSKDIGLLFYINFATGAAMYSVLYFCNLYFTMVKLYGPTYAGTQLLYYTPGLGMGVYLSMYFLNGWPQNTFAPLMLGSIVEAVGVGILAWALYSGRLPAIFGMMALTGAGTGMRLMPASLHAVGFFPKHVATVVSLMAVALPLGGTLTLTVMAAIFNNSSGIASSSPLRSVTTLNQLPPDALADVVHKAKMGIVWAYVGITPIMAMCVIAALLLGNVQIANDATKAKKATKAKSAAPSSSSSPVPAKAGVESDINDGRHIIRGVYLLAMLRGQTEPQQDEEGQRTQHWQQSRQQQAARPPPPVIPQRPAPREKTIQAFVEP